MVSLKYYKWPSILIVRTHQGGGVVALHTPCIQWGGGQSECYRQGDDFLYSLIIVYIITLSTNNSNAYAYIQGEVGG